MGSFNQDMPGVQGMIGTIQKMFHKNRDQVPVPSGGTTALGSPQATGAGATPYPAGGFQGQTQSMGNPMAGGYQQAPDEAKKQMMLAMMLQQLAQNQNNQAAQYRGQIR